jgi:ABC-2 type transport system permease protein
MAAKKYLAAFSLSVKKSMEYRMDFFLGLLGGFVVLLVQYFLWTAVFQSAGRPSVGGYTYSQLIAYTVFSAIAAKLTAAGFESEIADDIKLGGLNKFLTQPLGYAPYRFMAFLGNKLTQFIGGAVLTLALVGFFGSALGVDVAPLNVALFFPAVFFGMVINFFVFYTTSALAFRMTEVWGVFIAMRQGSFLLGGGIFPLDMMGAGLRRALKFLPFEYTIFFQAGILSGRLTLGEIVRGFLCQGLWIVLLGVVSRYCWKAGLKKHIAAGG